MATFTVEDILPFFSLEGEAHMHEGVSTGGFPGGAPIQVIQRDQPCYVHFRWKTKGPLNAADLGKWVVRVYFEQMGPGEGPSIPTVPPVDFVPTKDGRSYQAVVPIGANSIPTGLYRVTVSLTLVTNIGIPLPIAAFADLGMMQCYSA